MDCSGGREGGNADIVAAVEEAAAEGRGGMEEELELPIVWEEAAVVTVENDDDRWEMQANKMESVLSIIISGAFNSTRCEFAYAKSS